MKTATAFIAGFVLALGIANLVNFSIAYRDRDCEYSAAPYLAGGSVNCEYVALNSNRVK